MAGRSEELWDHPALRCWLVDTSEFPAGDTVQDALRFCLRYAVLAPSGHNTQPWWFHVHGTTVTVGLDRARHLPVMDPRDREALISVGAATFFLRVALVRFGFPVAVALLPPDDTGTACVRLDVAGPAAPQPELNALFDAITARHTSRTAFERRPVPHTVLQQLAADVTAEGAHLTVITESEQRNRIAALVSAADHVQMRDKRFRRELATWLRSAHSRRPDGIHWHGTAVAELLSAATPVVVRTFDVGDGQAARDEKLAAGSPVLAILSTDGDDQPAWLAAGQALGRMLLRAAADDVQVGYLNQPIEVEDLRPRLVREAAADGVPQLLLRLGYAPAAPPQPRRPVEDVLARAGDAYQGAPRYGTRAAGTRRDHRHSARS